MNQKKTTNQDSATRQQQLGDNQKQHNRHNIA